MPQAFSSKPKFGLSKTLKIGVLCGGTSSERVISQRSGKAVAEALKRCGYDVLAIDPKNKTQLLSKLRTIDVAFIALHGAGGEDGQIQALLEKQKIPYVGSDPLGCRLSFKKEVAKKYLRASQIPTPDWLLITEKNWRKKLLPRGRELFIKPCDEGSSIGVFTVRDAEKAKIKILKAIRKYKTLLVEERIAGREFTVGILGHRTLPVVELVTRRGFYDYRAKYTKGLTRYKVPAPIPKSLERKLKHLAMKTHRALGLRDMSRVDMMVSNLGEPYVLEANAIPGFTQLSLLPKAARSAGINFESLCTELVGYAHRRKSNGLLGENINGS